MHLAVKWVYPVGLIAQKDTHDMLPLSALGPRIIILGPSNSGKSTLAVALAQKLSQKKPSLRAVHLDQLRHIPNTNWQERPYEDFQNLHDAAIAQDAWVMDGNYTSLLAQRFDRATGVITLNSNAWFRYIRYVRRTLRNAQDRAGHLEGGHDRLSWTMTSWIIKTRNNGARNHRLARASGKPHVACNTAKELDALYHAWDLALP